MEEGEKHIVEIIPIMMPETEEVNQRNHKTWKKPLLALSFILSLVSGAALRLIYNKQEYMRHKKPMLQFIKWWVSDLSCRESYLIFTFTT